MDPKYHPKIIGRKGAVITQIRLEHDVSIQFPDKDDGSQVSTPLRSGTAPCWGQVGLTSTFVLTWEQGAGKLVPRWTVRGQGSRAGL